MSDFFILATMFLKMFNLLLFFCVIQSIDAQEITNEYIPEYFDVLKVYLKRINSNHIQKVEGQYASKIKKLYKDRDEKIIKSIEDSAYIFNSEIKNKLDVVLNNIYDSNPEIDTKEYKFFIKNSIVPNAACYGDGLFEINLGLLNILDSEDELAFIICHEIAHKLKDHSLKNVRKGVGLLNSKDTKNKIKHIKRSKYGQTRAALSVIDGLNIDMLDYSKEVEAEADSVGFYLFSRTKYKKQAAITSLEKLKKKDEMIFHFDVKVDSVFDFRAYPFKKYWLKESTSLFDTDEVINEFSLVSDTLKTHPEIAFRVDKLTKDFSIDNSNIKTRNQNQALNAFKEESQIRIVQFACDLNTIDLAIYQLIHKYKKSEINPSYYYTKMAEVLKLVYEAKKKHALGKYVPLKNSLSDEKQLNIIRLFLHNLELDEIKKIGLAFCESNVSKISKNENFSTAHEFFKTINNK